LKGQYKKLQFKYGVDDRSPKGSKGKIVIYDDNELLSEFIPELYDDLKLATIDVSEVII